MPEFDEIKIDSLHKELSHKYDLGSLEDFKAGIMDDDRRSKIYYGLSAYGEDLGDTFEQFSKSLKKKEDGGGSGRIISDAPHAAVEADDKELAPLDSFGVNPYEQEKNLSPKATPEEDAPEDIPDAYTTEGVPEPGDKGFSPEMGEMIRKSREGFSEYGRSEEHDKDFHGRVIDEGVKDEPGGTSQDRTGKRNLFREQIETDDPSFLKAGVMHGMAMAKTPKPKELITPLKETGYSPEIEVAGKKGRFNFAAEPKEGGTPGKRYLFEAEDGSEWYFQLEKAYQGGRWEDAWHAQEDYDNYRRAYAFDPEGLKEQLNSMWPKSVATTIYNSVANGKSLEHLKGKLEDKDTWRQISGEPEDPVDNFDWVNEIQKPDLTYDIPLGGLIEDNEITSDELESLGFDPEKYNPDRYYSYPEAWDLLNKVYMSRQADAYKDAIIKKKETDARYSGPLGYIVRTNLAAIREVNAGTARFFRTLDDATVTIEDAVANTFDMFDPGSSSVLPDNEHGFAKWAEYIEQHKVEHLPEFGDDMVSQVGKGLFGMTDFFLELAITPNWLKIRNAKAWRAWQKGLSKVKPKDIPLKLPAQMGGGNFVREYARAKEEGRSDMQKLTAGITGLGYGIKDAAILMGLGYTASTVGKSVAKVTDGITGRISSVATNSLGFGTLGAIEALNHSGGWTPEVWEEFLKQAGVGVGISLLPHGEFEVGAGLKSNMPFLFVRKARQNWARISDNNINKILNMAGKKAENLPGYIENLRKRSVELEEQAIKESDPEAREGKKSAARVLDSMADVLAISNEVMMDRKTFKQWIKNDPGIEKRVKDHLLRRADNVVEHFRPEVGAFDIGTTNAKQMAERAMNEYNKEGAATVTNTGRTIKPGQKGYIVSPYKEREKTVSTKEFTEQDVREFAEENKDLLNKSDHSLGLWVEGGKVYMDVSVRTAERATAEALGKKARQKAIYDVENDKIIDLDRVKGRAVSTKKMTEIVDQELKSEANRIGTEMVRERIRQVVEADKAGPEYVEGAIKAISDKDVKWVKDKESVESKQKEIYERTVEEIDKMDIPEREKKRLREIAKEESESIGFRISEGGKETLYIHPERAQKDTPWHEHSHVLIDKLERSNAELYKEGLDIIKGTEFEVYAEAAGYKNPTKEALVSAVGRWRQLRHEKYMSSNKYQRFVDWMGRLADNAARMLGLKNPEGMTFSEWMRTVERDIKRPSITKKQGVDFQKAPEGVWDPARTDLDPKRTPIQRSIVELSRENRVTLDGDKLVGYHYSDTKFSEIDPHRPPNNYTIGEQRIWGRNRWWAYTGEYTKERSLQGKNTMYRLELNPEKYYPLSEDPLGFRRKAYEMINGRVRMTVPDKILIDGKPASAKNLDSKIEQASKELSKFNVSISKNKTPGGDYTIGGLGENIPAGFESNVKQILKKHFGGNVTASWVRGHEVREKPKEVPESLNLYEMTAKLAEREGFEGFIHGHMGGKVVSGWTKQPVISPEKAINEAVSNSKTRRNAILDLQKKTKLGAEDIANFLKVEELAKKYSNLTATKPERKKELFGQFMKESKGLLSGPNDRPEIYEKLYDTFKGKVNLPTRGQLFVPHGGVELSLHQLFMRNPAPTGRQLFNALMKAFPANTPYGGKKAYPLTDYATLVHRLETMLEIRDMFLKEGKADLLDWYPGFNKLFEKTVGKENVSEASALFAIMSAQKRVIPNFMETIEIMRLAREINPVTNPNEFSKALIERRFADPETGKADNRVVVTKTRKPGHNHDKIVKLYQEGIFQGQNKTSTYARHIRAGGPANIGDMGSVMDVHMNKVFGFEKPPSPGDAKRMERMGVKHGAFHVMSKENADRYAQYMTAKLGQGYGLSPMQTQTLLWHYGRSFMPSEAYTKWEKDPWQRQWAQVKPEMWEPGNAKRAIEVSLPSYLEQKLKENADLVGYNPKTGRMVEGSVYGAKREVETGNAAYFSPTMRERFSFDIYSPILASAVARKLGRSDFTIDFQKRDALRDLDNAVKLVSEEFDKVWSGLEYDRANLNTRADIRRAGKEDVRKRRAEIALAAFKTNLVTNSIDAATSPMDRKVLTFMQEKQGIPDVPGMEEVRAHYESNKNRLEPIAEKIGEYYQSMWEKIVKNTDMLSAKQIENYVTHIWDIPRGRKKDVVNWFATKNRFLNVRYIESLKEGMEKYGLTPRELDISKLIQVHAAVSNNVIANQRFVEDLKSYETSNTDWLKLETSQGGETSISPGKLMLPSSVAPASWITVDHPAFNRGVFKGEGYVFIEPVKMHPDLHQAIKPVIGQTISDPYGVIKAYEGVANVMKKTALSISLFHHLALTETAIPKSAKGTFKSFTETPLEAIRNGRPVPLAKQKITQDALIHGVQFGVAVEDINVAQIQGALDRWAELPEKYGKKLGLPKVAYGPGKMLLKGIAKFNKAWDAALWDYLHDSFKLFAYESAVSKGPPKWVKTPEDITEWKRAEAQLVNDTFGGQNWDVLGLSPRTVQLGRWVLLSPDWTVSTTRQALSPAGVGTKAPREGSNITKRTRMTRGAAFWGKAALIYGIGQNILNYYFRKRDMEEYPELYTLEEMDFWDMTMVGNSFGHKTHLFVGRNDNGTERYLRTNKQFRELPEMLFDEDGAFTVLRPTLKRLGSKSAPPIQLITTLATGRSPSGFEDWTLQDKKGWQWMGAALQKVATSFTPFSLGTLVRGDRKFRATDIMLPSSSGYSNRQARDDFKQGIHDYLESGGGMGYIKEVYSMAIRNNLYAKDLFDQALRAAELDIEQDLMGRVSNTLEEHLEKRQELIDDGKWNELIKENWEDQYDELKDHRKKIRDQAKAIKDIREELRDSQKDFEGLFD